jgi:hypothetical protein
MFIVGMLVWCNLSSIGIQQGLLLSPCYTNHLGNPFAQPTTYVTYRIDRQGQRDAVYLLEIGQSQPIVNRGLQSHAWVLLRIPVTPRAQCRGW